MARSLNVEILADASQYERTLRRAARSTQQFNTSIKRQGLSLGKTFAASFGIGLGAAGLVRGLQTVIAEATEHATVQKQLEAQFRASGVALQDYQAQIDETVNRLSILAGVDDEEVLTSFTAVFRATKDVQLGLKVTAIAADVAKGAHKDLGQTTLALTKVLGGQNTALRRMGILLPANVTGMEAINFVARKFAGQAEAGTTSQERFNIALKNMEEAIGTALLPTFNKYLDKLTVWLGDSKNQKKIQDDVTAAVNAGAAAFDLLAGAVKGAGDAYKWLNDHLPGGTGWSLQDLIGHLPGGNQSLLEMLGLRGGGGGGGIPTPLRAGQPGFVGPIKPAARPAAAPVSFDTPEKRKRRASLAYQMSLINLQLAKAELTAAKNDDRAILVRQAALLRRQIAGTKDLKARTAFYQQLANVNKQIDAIDEDAAQTQAEHHRKELETRKKIAEAAKEHARKVKEALAAQRAALLEQQAAAQFRALGLTGTGEERVATKKALRKQLAKALEAIEGTVADTAANRALLARIRRVLYGRFGKLGREVRSTIEQMLDTVFSQLDQTTEQVKRRRRAFLDPGFGHGVNPTFGARGIMAGGLAGGVRIDNLNLYGVQDVRQLENELVKRSTTRPQPRRGP